MLTTTTATKRWPCSRHLSNPALRSSRCATRTTAVRVGGPIWRDHTFFFLTYEEQKFVIGEPNTVTEPSPAYQALALAELTKYNVQPSQVSQNILSTLWDPTAIASLPATPGNYSSSAPQAGYSHNAVAHLDHNFSDKSHLSAIWYFGQGYADAPSCVFVCSYLPEYFQTVPSHIQNYNAVWNYNLRPNLSNQLAAGVNYFMQDFADENHSQNPLTLAGLNTGASLSGAPQIAINGFDSIGVTPTSGRNDISGQIADTLSWTVGKHQFRFGLEYRRAYIDLYYNWGARGAFNFGTAEVSGPGQAILRHRLQRAHSRRLPCRLLRIRPASPSAPRSASSTPTPASAFAEDSWQVTPKLNVNLGLRYDYQQPYYTNNPNLSIFDPSSSTGLVVASGAPARRITSTTATRPTSRRASGSPTRLHKAPSFAPTTASTMTSPPARPSLATSASPTAAQAASTTTPPAASPTSPSFSRAEQAPIWTYNQATPIFTPSPGAAHRQQRGLHLLGRAATSKHPTPSSSA